MEILESVSRNVTCSVKVKKNWKNLVFCYASDSTERPLKDQ